MVVIKLDGSFSVKTTQVETLHKYIKIHLGHYKNATRQNKTMLFLLHN